ncbi:MAG: radical SAM protein [Methanomicrobiales archaeon]|nr:radical SAM protein [Methanomicrobiales archaeon]
MDSAGERRIYTDWKYTFCSTFIQGRGFFGIQINLAGYIPRSSVNGPGIRCVLWTQGCPIRCTGCFNQDLWAFEPRTLLEHTRVAEEIFRCGDIDGVTFSGGEPFAQASALAELGVLVHEKEMSVVTCTGFSHAQLRHKNRSSWNALLDVTDLLIAGPFTGGNGAVVCGDLSHKEMIPLSDRGQAISDSADKQGESMEFVIRPDGTVIATGFPDGEIRRTLREMAGF